VLVQEWTFANDTPLHAQLDLPSGDPLMPTNTQDLLLCITRNGNPTRIGSDFPDLPQGGRAA
jgi:hypothetical protein